MKTTGFSLLLGCLLQGSLAIQLAAQTLPPNTNTPSPSAAPTIVRRSANERLWARITSVTNDLGQVTLATNAAYTEVGSGLCYVKDGQWTDAVEQIDIVADGAAATQAASTVHFAGNANTAGGAIHMVAPDGSIFDSRVYGLGYWDSASGTNFLIAPLQDCAGTVMGDNIVLYTNAFKGLLADIEYTFTKSVF